MRCRFVHLAGGRWCGRAARVGVDVSSLSSIAVRIADRGILISGCRRCRSNGNNIGGDMAGIEANAAGS